MHRIFESGRVLELAQWIFVPSTGALLADLGADVIKVEHPNPKKPLELPVPCSGLSGEHPTRFLPPLPSLSTLGD